jgi:hypothetical protein
LVCTDTTTPFASPVAGVEVPYETVTKLAPLPKANVALVVFS